MITWYGWLDRRRERSRQRLIARQQLPARDDREERLLRLNTFKEWGIIEEDEYQDGIRALASLQSPTGRAWELRAEVRARDRRSRRRRP
jgi:hypothetical protein